MNDWLMMLYLGADDDLLPFGKDLLDEVGRVGSTDRVEIRAELNRTPADAKTLRGRIRAGQTHDELQNIGIANGGVESIIDFVDDAREQCESLNRALILWDHGNGWQNVHVFDFVATAIDEVRKHRQLTQFRLQPVPPDDLRVNDLRAVLDEKRGIAVVGFDSCLMSMIEVAFQLRDTAKFMVASQHVVPAGRGWPYEAFLRALVLDPRMHPEALVRAIVDTFAGSYNGSKDAVTLTGLRLSTEVDRAVSAVDSLSRALLTAISKGDRNGTDVRGEIVYARRHTQSFGNQDYIDLLSLCDQLLERLRDDQLSRAVDLVRIAMSRLIVRHNRSSARSLANANGVSIYFPQPAEGVTVAPSYQALDFANPLYCRWSVFLKVLVEGAAVRQDWIDTPLEEDLGDDPAATLKPLRRAGGRTHTHDPGGRHR